MPEFHLDVGSPEGAMMYRNLDSFTQGYIEAMFFTDASDPDDGELQDATFAEFAPGMVTRIQINCEAFQKENADLLAQAYELDGADTRTGQYDAERAGNDYWYTRNGHGTGFWDRNLGQVGEQLANAARKSRSIGLYRGDDGLIYLA